MATKRLIRSHHRWIRCRAVGNCIVELRWIHHFRNLRCCSKISQRMSLKNAEIWKIFWIVTIKNVNFSSTYVLCFRQRCSIGSRSTRRHPWVCWNVDQRIRIRCWRSFGNNSGNNPKKFSMQIRISFHFILFYSHLFIYLNSIGSTVIISRGVVLFVRAIAVRRRQTFRSNVFDAERSCESGGRIVAESVRERLLVLTMNCHTNSGRFRQRQVIGLSRLQ